MGTTAQPEGKYQHIHIRALQWSEYGLASSQHIIGHFGVELTLFRR